MTITIKYDGKIKRVDLNEFVKAAHKMLEDFGLKATEDHIEAQVHAILNGGELDVIGIFLKDYVVV